MESMKEISERKGAVTESNSLFCQRIRTHVPVTRQLDFESSSLWPLRYVSNAYLLYYAFDRISNIFLPFLKEVKEKIMQFFRNSLQILKDTMQ